MVASQRNRGLPLRDGGVGDLYLDPLHGDVVEITFIAGKDGLLPNMALPTLHDNVHVLRIEFDKGPPLTPVSGHEAKVVAANILEGNHLRPDYRGVPSAAFTLPPIAAVGLSEAAARQQCP